MNPTEKLYWSDALATAFDAQGASLGEHGGRPSIIVGQTLFYPEGGGQLGDSGTLAIGAHAVRIADTQVTGGVIHHVIDGEVDGDLAEALRGSRAEALAVRGTIDEAKRRDNMVHHTAQHALSRALATAARADTVSARLGATSCTIDVARPGVSDADLHRAEDLVNAIVMSDAAIHTSFPSAEELAKLDLRKQPNAEKSAAGVRVVEIEGFDLTPCGGTHCTRTGQVGHVRITATEKYKGMLRITFHAGRRALAEARAGHELLAALATDLTCGADDIPAAVGKLRAELKGLREKLDSTRAELAGQVALRVHEMLPASSGPHVVRLERPLDDLAGLRALATSLTTDPRVIALVSGEDATSGELIVVLQRGGGVRLDCGPFVTAQAKALGGRGGGRPERAEGRFPRGTSLEALAAAATATASREDLP